jgi:hypothetical protein
LGLALIFQPERHVVSGGQHTVWAGFEPATVTGTQQRVEPVLVEMQQPEGPTWVLPDGQGDVWAVG